jgi:hypothetical protein
MYGSRTNAAAILATLVALGGCSSKHEAPPPPVAKEVAPATTTRSGAVAEATPAVVADAGKGPRTLGGKKVLHVGDSMVGGTFGLTRALEGKLTAEGATIIRHTKVSETLSSFDKAPTLKDLMRTHEPDIVVITLGANDANVPHPEVYAHSIENIVRRVGDRECWWIGPPKVKEAGGSGPSAAMSIVSVLEQHTGTCRFFDSSKLELDRAADGVHPNDRGASRWADAFWEVFRTP